MLTFAGFRSLPISGCADHRITVKLHPAGSRGISRELRLFVAQGTGLPAPDGNRRAQQTAAVHAAALRHYSGAIRRCKAFLGDGKPPEDQAPPRA